MNRREILGWLGAQGTALTALQATADAADDHGRPVDGHGDDFPDPAKLFHLYLCAFHIAKKEPSFAVEAHHYCSPVGDDLHQCLVYDRRGPNAKLIGIEYIVPDAVYRALPEAEKKYWHPHSYEILSGQLTAPLMKPDDEDKLFEGLITTWGKTWHTWPDPTTNIPLGEPLLMWSTSRDGMLDPELIAKRDQQFGFSTAAIRKRRSFMGQVPNIDPPKSLDDLGRQFTNDGPDVPPKR